jgi:hypothetical protein
MGIELELEFDGNRAMNSLMNLSAFFVTKNDGSLDDGVEIVSHPATLKYLQENRSLWEDVLNMYGLEAEYTCGMHVHLSDNAFSRAGLRRFADFVFDNESFTKSFSERDGNYSYCRFDKGSYEDGNRVALAHDMYAVETLEVRFFRATQSKTTFWANLEFCHALYWYTKRDRELSPEAFMGWVRSKGDKYKNLKSKLCRLQLMEREQINV